MGGTGTLYVLAAESNGLGCMQRSMVGGVYGVLASDAPEFRKEPGIRNTSAATQHLGLVVELLPHLHSMWCAQFRDGLP